MFLLRLRAGRFVLCGSGFDCLFHLWGRGNSDTTTVVDKIVVPFCLVFPFPCFPFYPSLGRGKEEGGGGGLPGPYS